MNKFITSTKYYFTILNILILCSCATNYQSNKVEITSIKTTPMNITRGLEPAIAEFTDLEQKLVRKVAEKLKERGYPLQEVTRVHIKKEVLNIKDFYSENDITFFINPVIQKQGGFVSGLESIGVGWTDPSVIRTADGGMEFEIPSRTKPEELIMDLYAVSDFYLTPIIGKNKIIQKIDNVFMINNLEEINYFVSKGLPELIKNYLIEIIEKEGEKNIYTVVLSRMNYDFVDLDYFHDLYKIYTLEVDLNTSKIKVLDSFDPTFFPSPAIMPSPFPTLDEINEIKERDKLINIPKKLKKSIIQAYREKDSYIGIVTTTKIEFIHQGTRGEKVLIDFKINQSIYGAINSELIQTGIYYNYLVNGEPPFTIGTKYLVVFRGVDKSNIRFWPESYQVLDCQNCQDVIEFCEQLKK